MSTAERPPATGDATAPLGQDFNVHPLDLAWETGVLQVGLNLSDSKTRARLAELLASRWLHFRLAPDEVEAHLGALGFEPDLIRRTVTSWLEEAKADPEPASPPLSNKELEERDPKERRRLSADLARHYRLVKNQFAEVAFASLRGAGFTPAEARDAVEVAYQSEPAQARQGQEWRSKAVAAMQAVKASGTPPWVAYQALLARFPVRESCAVLREVYADNLLKSPSATKVNYMADAGNARPPAPPAIDVAVGEPSGVVAEPPDGQGEMMPVADRPGPLATAGASVAPLRRRAYLLAALAVAMAVGGMVAYEMGKTTHEEFVPNGPDGAGFYEVETSQPGVALTGLVGAVVFGVRAWRAWKHYRRGRGDSPQMEGLGK